MAKFGRRVLGFLEGTYRFVGGQRSSSSVDIGAPVTVVHDVSRGSEQGTVLYFSHGVTVVTGGTGGAGDSTVDVAEILDAIGASLQEFQLSDPLEVWLCGFRVHITSVSAADLQRVTAAHIYPNRDRLVATGGAARSTIGRGDDATANDATTTGGVLPLQFVDGAGAERPFGWNADIVYPVPLGEVQVRCLDDATGAITVQYRVNVALAPPGIVPRPF